MKEKFKTYLEEQFRTIAPTKAAMEFRKKLLIEMLDREQELRIKGVTDDGLILKLVIDSLGDMPARLREFEDRGLNAQKAKRKVSIGVGIGVGAFVLFVLLYVVIGATTKLWHPTWLMLVGAAFLGITALFVYTSVKCIINKKYIILRLLVAAILVLFCVFTFLVLELIFKLNGSYLIFLAMIPALLGVDTAVAFLIDSKTRWFELPVFVEIFGVMVYVILGIALGYSGISIWHPGWLLCLIGVICALVEGIVFLALFGKKRAKKDKSDRREQYEKINESYWTEWDD